MMPTRIWKGLERPPGAIRFSKPGSRLGRRLATETTRPSNPRSLFLRWLWVTYLPLGLAAAGILLLLGGALPWWTLPALGALMLWGGLAVRLLMERRRQGLLVPIPKNLGTRIASLAALMIIGATLLLIGIARLSSGGGLPLLLLGILILLVALVTPAFKLADLTLRGGRRWLDERTRPPKASA